MRTDQQLQHAIDGLQMSIARHLERDDIEQITIKGYMLMALEWAQGGESAYLEALSRQVQRCKCELAGRN